jgi:hypothetical protein
MKFCQINIAFIILFIYQLLVLWYCYDLFLMTCIFFSDDKENVTTVMSTIYCVVISLNICYILLNQYFCGTTMSVFSGIYLFVFFAYFTIFACMEYYFKQNNNEFIEIRTIKINEFRGVKIGGLANRKRSKHIQKKRSRR